MYKYLLLLFCVSSSMIAVEDSGFVTETLRNRLKLEERDERSPAIVMARKATQGPSDQYFKFMEERPICNAVVCCVPTMLFMLSLPALATGAVAKEKLLARLKSCNSKSD